MNPIRVKALNREELTREEAQWLLKYSGLRLSHPTFTDEEWVQGTNMGGVDFEDGCHDSQKAFWHTRRAEAWDAGWVWAYWTYNKKDSK